MGNGHAVRLSTGAVSSLTLSSSACLRACRPFGRIPRARVEGEAYTKPSDHPPGSYRRSSRRRERAYRHEGERYTFTPHSSAIY